MPALQTLHDKDHSVQHTGFLQKSQATKEGTTQTQLPTAEGENLGPPGPVKTCHAKHE